MSSPAWPSPPPTRILSWQQIVLENDPNFRRQSLQPVVYEFSNGRLFVDTLPTYTPYAVYVTDDEDNVITDDQGGGIDLT